MKTCKNYPLIITLKSFIGFAPGFFWQPRPLGSLNSLKWREFLVSTPLSLTYSIENPKCFSDLVLGFQTRDLLGHHHQELGELDAAGPVGVDVVDHILEEERGPAARSCRNACHDSSITNKVFAF